MKTASDGSAPGKKAGPWQSTQYSNLVRYEPSGTYFARLRVAGKLIRRSLRTDVLSVAKLRLQDLEREERSRAEQGRAAVKGRMTFGDALAQYRANGFRPAIPRNRKDAAVLKPAALLYYEQRATALLRSWPGLEAFDLRKITGQQCEEWAARARRSMSATVFNHTLGLMRQVFAFGLKAGVLYQNPAAGIMRESELPKRLDLPSAEQFNALVAEIEGGGSGFSEPCAELVRFLAFSGLRISEATFVTWADIDLERGRIVVRGHPETGLKNRRVGETRIVPIIPEMRRLLERMRAERADDPADAAVMRVKECQRSLDRACKRVGIARITHHDMRHLFATRCIESGVDIPTVARWLGHRDGGALAMRVYGHLRDEHSTDMAQRVRFAASENESGGVGIELP